MVDLDHRLGGRLDRRNPGGPITGPGTAGRRSRLRSGRNFQGEVVRLNKEADTVTRELEVDVKFDQLPQPLVIGEEAEVDIDTGRLECPGRAFVCHYGREMAKGVLVVDRSLSRLPPHQRLA